MTYLVVIIFHSVTIQLINLLAFAPETAVYGDIVIWWHMKTEIAQGTYLKMK